MKIVPTRDLTIYVDGIHPQIFEAWREVEMPERIAGVLLGDGRAQPAEAFKSVPEAPENKMEAPGEDKARIQETGPKKPTQTRARKRAQLKG